MKSKTWSVLFETDSGSIHPLRFRYETPQLKSKARTDARIYLMQNQWLVKIEDIYAPDATPTQPTQKQDQM